MNKMNESVIKLAIESMEGWTYQDDNIRKTYVFKDFVEAVGFLNKVALISERLNHHADWSGVYNKVIIQLSTHDAGGVTENDFEFARLADEYSH